MLIKEQRGKRCPKGYDFNVGDLSCEECDHWKFKLSGRVNEAGIEYADEYCILLMEAEVDG